MTQLLPTLRRHCMENMWLDDGLQCTVRMPQPAPHVLATVHAEFRNPPINPPAAAPFNFPRCLRRFLPVFVHPLSGAAPFWAHVPALPALLDAMDTSPPAHGCSHAAHVSLFHTSFVALIHEHGYGVVDWTENGADRDNSSDEDAEEEAEVEEGRGR